MIARKGLSFFKKKVVFSVANSRNMYYNKTNKHETR